MNDKNSGLAPAVFGIVRQVARGEKHVTISLTASVAEWSIATDCKSVGFMPTLVRIQPGAQ